MNEREIAFAVMMDISEKNAYNNIVLKNIFEKNIDLSKVQKAFITEIVNGTMRNLIYIDYVIDQFSKVKTKKMKPTISNILRISVYQIMFMDRVQDFAVCNEAVNLAKKKKFHNLSGFVNGVLRNIARNKENIKLPDKMAEPIKNLSVKYSVPEWILNYWNETFTMDEMENICLGSIEKPKVSICINTVKTNKTDLKKILLSENVEVYDAASVCNILRLSSTDNMTNLDSFKNGLYHVMDESSALSVEALSPKENDTVIDVCAAPGGKSFYSAYKMNNMGRVISRDIHNHKIKLIDDSVKRLGLNIIKTEKKDAAVYYREDSKRADCVIVDAPCSGLGLFRKKPDIKYSKTLDDIKRLSEIQKEILASCYDYVKIGGVLIYSTCTISKLENEDNVKWFCENYNFELEDLTKYIKLPQAKVGYVQILPRFYDSDGFFIARFVRKG